MHVYFDWFWEHFGATIKICWWSGSCYNKKHSESLLLESWPLIVRKCAEKQILNDLFLSNKLVARIQVAVGRQDSTHKKFYKILPLLCEFKGNYFSKPQNFDIKKIESAVCERTCLWLKNSLRVFKVVEKSQKTSTAK